jgi:tetratricopeptide (TPR) repeat protein
MSIAPGLINGYGASEKQRVCPAKMATIAEALNQAVQHHQAGRFDAAADLYRQILEVEPKNFNALHLLGLTERVSGRLAQAAALMRSALELEPHFAEVANNLGNVLQALQDDDAAVRCYRRSLALNPGFAPAMMGLGGMRAARGGPDHWPEAITVLRWAERLHPGVPQTLHDLGLLLRQSERLEEALLCYERSIKLQPEAAGAWMSYGNALVEKGEWGRAAVAFRRGVALLPGGKELYFNLGNALHASGELEPAAVAYGRSARLGLGNGLTREAIIRGQQGRHEDVLRLAGTGLNLPGVDYSAAIELLTATLLKQNRAPDGRAFFERLATTPLGDGRVHPAECWTALADFDLHEGKPHAAAERLGRVAGDNCRMFTIKSLAFLQASLADRGLALRRPINPDPTRPRVTSSTLATHGRFAHNALEYVLIRLYAEKFGYVLETPDWVGGWYFDLDDPRPSGPLSPFYFSRRILNGLVDETLDRPPVADCDILSPLFLLNHRQEHRERAQAWLRPRDVWRPHLDPLMDGLRARGDTVVAIHIRRGDFVQFNYPITETAWYVAWLNEIWPTLKNPVLYIASDDLAGVRRDFAAFHPTTLGDLVEPWRGLEYLQDFHVLSNADAVGISAASGFSTLAARLNTRARLFAEPDVKAGRVRPFTPWTP